MKEMFHVWDGHHILQKIVPRLEHENDGLIFTVDACPYYPGTCPQIYKWKPPHLNSIDFNLVAPSNPSQPPHNGIYALSTRE